MESQIESDFNSIQFEKKLSALKDTQESIQQMSAWCLQNRQHHKKIVNSWLNVLKRVKVEHRLTLFYLANDVIQYSKRKNYEFVDSWGTTLQKATTMVRDEKVRHRILRIFKIWEQRAVYGEDFIGDLSGLLSAAAGKTKTDDPTEFQPTSLFSRLRQCATLEADTDAKLKTLTENPLSELDVLCNMLKDRRQVADVEQRIETDSSNAEGYVKALQSELRARGHLIALLEQAERFYVAQRGEVKVVANAYRNFGTRVKNLKRKLDELMPTLSSPVPSPDVNAPSPSPDSDIDLPGDVSDTSISHLGAPYSLDQSYNTSITNGFTSFMGGGMPFDINTSSLFEHSPTKSAGGDVVDRGGKPIEVINPNVRPKSDENFNISEFLKSLLPGQPAGMPSGQHLNKSHSTPPGAEALPTIPDYNPQRALLEYSLSASNIALPETHVQDYNSGVLRNDVVPDYNPQQTLGSLTSDRKPDAGMDYSGASVAPLLPPPMPPMMMDGPDGNPDYNQSYSDSSGGWNNSWNMGERQVMETPESPPCYEQEPCVTQPVLEYNDRSHGQIGAGVDVDQRVVPLPPPGNLMPQLNLGQDVDHRMKDIDHRNLISLTASPGQKPPESEHSMMPPLQPPHLPTWADNQSYSSQDSDQDYRIPPLPPSIGSFTSSPEKFSTHSNTSSSPMQHRPIQGETMPPVAMRSPVIPAGQRLNGIRFPSRPPPPPPPPPISSPTNFRSFRSPNSNNRLPLLETPPLHHKVGFSGTDSPRIKFHSSVRHAPLSDQRVPNVKQIMPVVTQSDTMDVKSSDSKQHATENTKNERENSNKSSADGNSGNPTDNVESIDMEMSDDETESGQHREHHTDKSNRLPMNHREPTGNLPPPRQESPIVNQVPLAQTSQNFCEPNPMMHRNRPLHPAQRSMSHQEDFTEEIDFRPEFNMERVRPQFMENEFDNRMPYHDGRGSRFMPPPLFQNFRGRGGGGTSQKMRPPFRGNPNRGRGFRGGFRGRW